MLPTEVRARGSALSTVAQVVAGGEPGNPSGFLREGEDVLFCSRLPDAVLTRALSCWTFLLTTGLTIETGN